ncbi:hypothetical protein CVT24_007739 [Panaeolus cyanescens]|uniref:CMP/dCMP-type deaminase domain-containing protein n=1 Tax=Panaeolus cyanescens TaxID=181874 RepID=A0A409YKM2_9AGAR|nr:hypothetical protein CVT24_007739 [Panaeolus cyanescens]
MDESNQIDHIEYIKAALEEAKKCTPVPTAFCVGCVLVARLSSASPSTIISTGYSRELPGNTHAEANALQKARALSPIDLEAILPGCREQGLTIDDILQRTDVYTTMEPCSTRTSGLAPCADALIASKVRRCFIGVGEPDDFVKCEGAQKLDAAGIKVIWTTGMEDECLAVARAGHARIE